MEAVTQADCVICYHAMRNRVDGALVNDGDFIAVVGKEMMLMKDFEIKKGFKCKTNLILMHSEASLSQVGYCDVFQREIVGHVNLLENDIKQSVDYKYAQHPLFEHDRGDASIRVAIIVGLGCNTISKRREGR